MCGNSELYDKSFLGNLNNLSGNSWKHDCLGQLWSCDAVWVLGSKMSLKQDDIFELDFFNLTSTFKIKKVMVKCKNKDDKDMLDVVMVVHPGGNVLHQCFVHFLNFFRRTPGWREEIFILELFLWRPRKIGGKIFGFVFDNLGSKE